MSKLIALEGPDGVGKTTQVRRLQAHLEAKGLPVHRTRQPSDGRVGVMIRQALVKPDPATLGNDVVWNRPFDDDTLALLFAADRRDHVLREVGPALDRGDVVVSDRWYHSSLVYQGMASDDLASQLGSPQQADQRWSWVHQLNAGVRVPDLTVVLYAPPKITAARRASRGDAPEQFDDPATQDVVFAGYLRTVQTLLSQGERVEALNGAGTVDEVAQRVAQAVDALLAGEPPRQVYVEGRTCNRPGVTLRGVATRLPSGLYESIAEVDGKTVVIETTIDFAPRFS